MSLSIRDEDLDQEIEQVAAELAAIDNAPDDKRGLELTGVEVLTFMALKVVLPITTSFLGRLLYDKYKNARKRNDLTAALEEAVSVGTNQGVDRAEVEEHVTASLVTHGIARERAAEIARDAYDRLHRRIFGSPPAKTV